MIKEKRKGNRITDGKQVDLLRSENLELQKEIQELHLYINSLNIPEVKLTNQKNFNLLNKRIPLGDYTEDIMMSWSNKITKNISQSKHPNNKGRLMTRDYNLDWGKNRVVVRTATVSKYYKDIERDKWVQRGFVKSDFTGNMRWSIKNIRMNELWDYMIMVVYYLDKEVYYLVKYEDINSETLGFSVSSHNHGSKMGFNRQFTVTGLSMGKLDKFKTNKTNLFRVLGGR